MFTIASFIIVIGIIVFVHELGHFLAAKLSGVRAEVFSLGFPPKIISRKFGETEYQICWIPLGGYVKMSGMMDESFDDDFDKDDPRGFIAQSFIKRVFIITAGVIMNGILAFVIYTTITFSEGVVASVESTITLVAPDSPAEGVGMLPGDVLKSIDGVDAEWGELTRIISAHPDDPIEITWLRNDSLYRSMITPLSKPSINFDTGERDTIGQIGVGGTKVMMDVTFVKAIGYGAAQVVGIVNLNIISLRWLLTGKAKVKELSGPLGIAKMSGDSARSGILDFLTFIAYISVSIGFLNILPIPMLDGGHLAFMIIEAVIRRPIPEKIKINLMKAGMAALLLLIIMVSYHDIIRIIASFK